MPREGERFTVGEFEIDIIDMDRQRIDKVGVRRIDAPTDPAVAEE
jgi:CBS domain containing-hemolysin-like protein